MDSWKWEEERSSEMDLVEQEDRLSRERRRRGVTFASPLAENSDSDEDTDASSSSEEEVEEDAPPVPVFKPFRPLLKRRTGRKGSKTAQDEDTANSPEVLAAKFQWARKTKDAGELRRVLEARNEEVGNGPIHRRISQNVIDEALLYSMLSRNMAFTRLLLEFGASINGADQLFNEARGDLSSCECGSHPGMLLITLVRQASGRLVEMALDELSVNTFICDGATRRMWWGTGYTFQGLQAVKMPVLKSQVQKTTPLSAAVESGDLNLVQLLVSRGAELLAHDCIAFIEAAKSTNDKKHRILKYLFGQLTRMPSFSANRKALVSFEAAASAALRSAAEHGDVNKLRCVIDILESEQDWVSSKNGKKVNSVFKQPYSEEFDNLALTKSGSHSSLASHTSYDSNSSSTSISSGNLAPHSMINYHKRRTSHVAIKNIINEDAVSRKHASRITGPVRSSKNLTIVERVLSKTIGQLVEEGADPLLADRRGLSRALEGLSMLDSATLSERRSDLFKVFLATLEQPGRTAENSALALLDSGLEDFLNEDKSFKSKKALEKAAKPSKKNKGRKDILSDYFGTPTNEGNERADSDFDLFDSDLEDGDEVEITVVKKHEKPQKSFGWKNIKRVLGVKPAAPRFIAKSRRASAEDKLKALHLACQSGHGGVLARLLGKIDHASTIEVVVPRLLCTAARNDSTNLVSLLLPYLGPDNQDALEDAYAVALESQAFDFADCLLEAGAKPSLSIYVNTYKSVVIDPTYREDSCEMLCMLMDQQAFEFSRSDVSSILDTITSTGTPNLYALACLLDVNEGYRVAVSGDHLMQCVKSSSKATENPDCQELLLILIKCLESSKELELYLNEAFNEVCKHTPVNAGVLHVLMNQSDHHTDESSWV